MRQPTPPGGHSPGQRGPFDDLLRPQSTRQPVEVGRGGLVALGIVALGILILVLLLPPISLLGRGGGSGSGGGGAASGNSAVKTTARKDMPTLPRNVQAISRFYDITTSGNVELPAVVTLLIPNPPADGRNISVYTLDGQTWKRLADGTLAPDGSAVEAELTEIPKNIVAVRRTDSARQTHRLPARWNADKPRCGTGSFRSRPRRLHAEQRRLSIRRANICSRTRRPSGPPCDSRYQRR